jgi:hypothetical protein
VIPFAPFEPDRTPFTAGASPNVINCLPVADGWGPLQQFVAVSDALAAAPKGAIAVRTSSGTYKIFAFTTTKAYQLDTSDYSWDDVSRLAGGDYACPSTDQWSLAVFGTYLIACNLADDPQYIDIDSGTNFAALPGSPPTAKFVGTAGDFVILAHTATSPLQVRTSAIGNAGAWTVGLNLSGDQTLPDGEDISGLFSAETGCLIFQRKKIRQLSITASVDYPFAITVLNASRGTIAPYSMTGIGPDHLGYLSSDGFCLGVEGRTIGTEKVDRWFFDTIDQAQVQDVRGAIDPYKKLFLWQATKPDTTKFMLAYSWALDRWGYSDQSTTLLTDLITPSVSWDGATALFATWDDATVSWDSRLLVGGSPTFGGFNSSYQLGFFTGTPMAARMDTGKVWLANPQKAFVTGARAVTDAATHTITFGSQGTHGGSMTFGSAVSLNALGIADKRIDGLWHQFRLDIAAGETWTHADGIAPKFRPSGFR